MISWISLPQGPLCAVSEVHISLHDDNPGFTTNPIKTPKECSSKQKIGPSDHISGVSSSPIFKKKQLYINLFQFTLTNFFPEKKQLQTC